MSHKEPDQECHVTVDSASHYVRNGYKVCFLSPGAQVLKHCCRCPNIYLGFCGVLLRESQRDSDQEAYACARCMLHMQLVSNVWQ